MKIPVQIGLVCRRHVRSSGSIVIVSMWIGNFMLIILNLPLVGLWVRLLTVPYHMMFPAIIIFCCIGAYSISSNAFDVYAMAGFGLLGYVLVKLECEPAPLLLGYVIGPMLEENVRRAMLLSRGDPTVFFMHPISGGLLLLAAVVLALALFPSIQKSRDKVFQE